jgi:hypothetical protein
MRITALIFMLRRNIDLQLIWPHYYNRDLSVYPRHFYSRWRRRATPWHRRVTIGVSGPMRGSLISSAKSLSISHFVDQDFEGDAE